MATKAPEAPWAAKDAELERVTDQLAELQERETAVKVRLKQLPALEARIRTEALTAGKTTWDVSDLVRERFELEAEAASIPAGGQHLMVRARELAEQVANLKAERLDGLADKIRARQQDRLAEVGRHVQAIADLYPDVVADEQALADLRAEITTVLGRPNHSLARPVAVPLAPFLDGFLDQAAWAATSKLARGRGADGRGHSRQPYIGAGWLDGTPDLTDDEGPANTVEGVQVFRGRVVSVMS